MKRIKSIDILRKSLYRTLALGNFKLNFLIIPHACFLLCLLLGFSLNAKEPSFKIKALVKVKKNHLTLNQIIDGKLQREDREIMSTVILKKNLKPLSRSILPGFVISKALKDLSYPVPKDLKAVTVIRRGKLLSDLKLKTYILKHLKSEFSHSPKVFRYKIEINKAEDFFKVPHSKLSFRVKSGAGKIMCRQHNMQIQISDGKGFFITKNIPVNIHCEMKMPVAKTQIDRGERLDTFNTSMKWQKIQFGQVPDALSQKDLLGMVAKRTVLSGRPIQMNMLSRPPLVTRGKPVKILLKRGGLVVMAMGIAKATAGREKVIPVLNPRSGRLIHGKVIATNLVEVEF